MPRLLPAIALVTLAALAVVGLLLAVAIVPSPYLVTPQPTYLSGHLVSMLTG